MSIGSIPPAHAAVVGDVAGRSVVLRFVDTSAEYGALRRGAMLVDRSERTRMRFSGPAAAEALTGLVTNDVLALAPGRGLYAAALTPKGKIIADPRILALEDGFLVDVPVRAAAGWSAMVKKFVNPRLAKYVDTTEATRDIGVLGTAARWMVAEAMGLAGESLEALPPYGHLSLDVEGAPSLLVRVPELGLEGFELIVAAEAAPALWQRFLAAGSAPAGLEAWEIARIEAGRPEWGLDIDETTIPQEANLEEMHAISYTKGCYTGQETVARVHFRGHVNRHLRGLHFTADDPLPAKTPLYDATGRLVGDVRSSAISPRLGGVALGMVRREVAISATLRAAWEGGDVPVTVTMLPFPL